MQFLDETYLFRKLPNINFASNLSVLDEYLPWADRVQIEYRITTAETEINKKEDPCSESA